MYWTQELQRIMRETRQAYIEAGRNSSMLAMREHEPRSKELKQALRRERRRRSQRENEQMTTAPLSRKPQAIKVDQRGRKRALDRKGIIGKQVSLSEFTKYLEKTNRKHEYTEFNMVPFKVWRRTWFRLRYGGDEREDVESNKEIKRPRGRSAQTAHTSKCYKLTRLCVLTF